MSLFQSALDAFRSGQYRPPTAHVPAETMVDESGGRFSFGLPWPWYVDPEPVRSSGALSSLLLLAPRTDRPASILVQVVPEKTELDDGAMNGMARQFARARNAKARNIRKWRIGGLPAIDLCASDGSLHQRLVLLPDDDVTIQLDAQFPESAAAGYGVHLESMLAAWSWH